MKKERQKTAVITGATSGIGLAVALRLLRDGAKAYLLGNRFDRLKALIENQVDIDASNAGFCHVNLENEAEINQTTLSITKELYVDYLIHCAGYYDNKSFEHADVTSLDTSYRVNVRAPYLITKQLLPGLTRARGSLVFINSSVVMGIRKKNILHYSTMKTALKNMADLIRLEVSDCGIRVVNVVPGKTATPMQQRVSEQEGYAFIPEKMLQPEQLADVIHCIIHLPASVEVTDISIRPSVKYGND
jgi:NADP-dependent 3-hydroxy acid dehydrogenase YdfG